VGPGAGLAECGKTRPHRDSIPGPSSPWQVAIPTELSRPSHQYSRCVMCDFFFLVLKVAVGYV
jgi:hypothetical protein